MAATVILKGQKTFLTSLNLADSEHKSIYEKVVSSFDITVAHLLIFTHINHLL